MRRFKDEGVYFVRDGADKKLGDQVLCRKKLSFFSTEKQVLFDQMFELSHEQGCIMVKISKDTRGLIHAASCFFTTESAIGHAWAKYESHPSFWVAIEDDDFTNLFQRNTKLFRAL